MDDSSPRPWKHRLLVVGRLIAGVVLSLGLGWLAIRGLDWSLVTEELQKFPLPYAFLALGVFLVSNLLRSLRWRVLFINERISVMRLFLVQNEGLGLNNLVPLRVVSEAFQLAILTLRDRINGATALVTLGMERVIDVISSTLLLVLAFFFVPEMSNFTLYIWGAVGFTVVVVLLVRFVAWGSHSVKFLQRIPLLASFASALALLEKERLRLTVSLVLSVAFWLLVGLSAWIVAQGLGLDISLATATVVIIGTVFFVTALPAMPAAIGTFEFSIVYILRFFGIQEEASFGFAVIMHALLFLPPTLIALVFVPREGLGGLRQLSTRIGRSPRVAQGPPS